MDGGVSTGVDWSDDVEEVRMVWRGKVMNDFEGRKEHLKLDAAFHREPVKLLKKKGDVMGRGASWDGMISVTSCVANIRDLSTHMDSVGIIVPIHSYALCTHTREFRVQRVTIKLMSQPRLSCSLVLLSIAV